MDKVHKPCDSEGYTLSLEPFIFYLFSHDFPSFSCQSQSQSYLRTDGHSASLSWCQVTIRAGYKFFFLLEIFFRQLRVCYFVAPSLTRGWVCNLLLLLVLASAVPLGPVSRGT
jgi:hypothetical protein